MFEQDWILRQIDTLVQFVARVVFQKDYIQYDVEDADHLTETDDLYMKLNTLLRAGKICEAEDLLFDSRSSSREFLAVAVDFYQKLSKMSDEELEAHNFSRQEIYDGLKEIVFSFKGMPALPIDL